jgi:hypothetical protein
LASWLNLVERWFAELTEKRSAAASTAAHASWNTLSVASSIATTRTRNLSFWTKSADQILDSMARFCKQH